MGKVLESLLGLGVVGVIAFGIHKKKKADAEEERRRNTPCVFEPPVTEDVFSDIAISEGKRIKRLRVAVDGPVVAGTVTSVSGISTWCFTLDFNDYGHITGRYWLNSENYDSSIPSILAKRIQERIQAMH